MKAKYGVTVKGVGLYADIKGLEGIAQALKDIPDKARVAAAKSLNDSGFDLEGKAINLAPIDTGALRKSGMVNEATPQNLLVQVGVGYEGSPALVEGHASPAMYALRQHEELTWKHPNGGQAKFLEQPFKENINKYVDDLADAVRKAVGDG
jgi:hypothetical protein